MMKLKTVFTTMLLFALPVCWAQNIAVIDYERAILRSDYAVKRFEELESSEAYKVLVSELNARQADLQVLSDEVKKSEDWSANKRRDFQEKARNARTDYELAVQRVNGKKQQLLQEIAVAMQEKAAGAIQELIKSERIDLLVDRQATLSVTERYDLTDKLIAKINQK